LQALLQEQGSIRQCLFENEKQWLICQEQLDSISLTCEQE